MQKISPFLWFNGNAEEAVNFYVSVFKGSVIGVMRYGEAGPGPKGSVMTMTFQLHGQEFIALNGGPEFTFSEAISLSIDCADQAEVDRYWEALLADGGQPSVCGWLKDRFGLSWQVVPRQMTEMFNSPDRAGASRAMEAMLKMVKIDVAEIERAFAGDAMPVA